MDGRCVQVSLVSVCGKCMSMACCLPLMVNINMAGPSIWAATPSPSPTIHSVRSSANKEKESLFNNINGALVGCCTFAVCRCLWLLSHSQDRRNHAVSRLRCVYIRYCLQFMMAIRKIHQRKQEFFFVEATV